MTPMEFFYGSPLVFRSSLVREMGKLIIHGQLWEVNEGKMTPMEFFMALHLHFVCPWFMKWASSLSTD